MLTTQIRPGAYFDSVVLMQLQRALAQLPRVDDAGVVMGTTANKDLLRQSGLLSDDAGQAKDDDLIIVIRAVDAAAGEAALVQVDDLLAARRSNAAVDDYRPKSLEAAVQMLPEARWVLVSVPGRYAAGVAREALRLGKNVFLYSDNVALDDEVALKQEAHRRGLLVMGPDCGTAIVNGTGLGFANRVRRGNIGLVGASGTGLQQVTARIHQRGGGITHALGTGGRDLSDAVGAVTARQGLALLRRDPETAVIVLISKPPSPAVAADLLQAARATGKTVIINFIGYEAHPSVTAHEDDNLHFARTLDETAAMAVALTEAAPAESPGPTDNHGFASGQRYLRGLYSGGTLAYEALLLLADSLPGLYSNAPLDPHAKLENAAVSREHTIVDLGEDEYTVGRLHPMLDNALRIQRLEQEAADPATAVILLDVVLGDGAHPDPAGELAPAVAKAKAEATAAGRRLEVVAVVVGTDEDPQGLAHQVAQLEQAGVQVESSHEAAVRQAAAWVQRLGAETAPAVALEVLTDPLAAINVGLESFTDSLTAQGAAVVQVDWRPPAGGNERLAGILARMKRTGS